MASPRVLLIEVDAALTEKLREELAGLGVQVATALAPDAVKQLLEAPPDLAIVNFSLSQGSGFGLVNRVLRMEALSGLQVVLVVNDDATEAAIDTHRKGPTPADAYVKPTVDAVLEATQRLLTEPIPEVPEGELTEVPPEQREDPLERVIRELGYRLLRRLPDEDGGAGAVFACRDDDLQRAVAIKVMKPESVADDRDELMQRFERERRILALLRSPYVLGVYGAGSHRGMPYLVRELIDGESLADHIKHEGALDVATALRYARDTALGLSHAASFGVIHRDVGPQNIHVVDDHAKIARFAMGKRDNDAKITRAGGLLMDDMTFIAPERVRGQEDLRGDIYALGVTLHMLIAGRSPFSSAACVDIISGKRTIEPVALDKPHVAALVTQLIQEDPERRPQTWDEVIALIDKAARAVTPEERRSSVVAPTASEPSAVHGTLRMMSVVEIVQSLELSRRTATVFLPSASGPEGKLAFASGALVHASIGDAARGKDAFFDLVGRKNGAFRVEYEPLAAGLQKNIDTPVAGLLLEAARRDDESSTGADERAMAAAVEKAVDSKFLENSGERFPAFTEEDPPDRGLVEPSRAPRSIRTAWGAAVIAVCTIVIIFGARSLPLLVDLAPAEPASDDDPSRAVDELFVKTREELRVARAELAALEPKLTALDKKTSAQEKTRERAKEIHGALEKAIQEISDRRIALGMAKEGDEVIIEIAELAIFTADGDEVTAEGKTVLARIAAALAPLMSGVDVRVDGHSDDVVPGARVRHRNNWGFSGARAASVASALVAEGLAASRVKSVAMADTTPVASNRGPKGRARNRRIEVHVIPRANEAGLK